MFGSWRTRLQAAEKAYGAGDLESAVRRIRADRLAAHAAGRRLVHRVVESLVGRAQRAAAAGDFDRAWQDLDAASTVAAEPDEDRLKHEKNLLVELVVGQADEWLRAGKPVHAAAAARSLKDRRILDRRSDDIEFVCREVAFAEQLAAGGKGAQALTHLARALERRPDLEFLRHRVQALTDQQVSYRELTAQLREAMTTSHWARAEEVTRTMLQIAPSSQLAMDALRRCQSVAQRGGRSPATSDTLELGPSRGFESTVKVKDGASEPPPADAQVVMAEIAGSSEPARRGSFLLWIDGVGGFLVCRHPVVEIGQALPNSSVDIPIQGDLRRRHLRLHRVEGGYLAEPLAACTIDGRPATRVSLLRDGQYVGLGDAVRFQFSMAHVLSQSARLDYVSRHRTRPWSDGVLLMADTLILGPHEGSHVVCPEWEAEVILYQRGDVICCRASIPLEIDGESRPAGSPVPLGSRVSGRDFAFSIEPVPCEAAIDG